MNALEARAALIDKGYIINTSSSQQYPLVSSLLTSIERNPAAAEAWLQTLDDVENETTASRTYALEAIAKLMHGLSGLVYEGALPARTEVTVVDVNTLETKVDQDIAVTLSE